jgi:hypothetical protein
LADLLLGVSWWDARERGRSWVVSDSTFLIVAVKPEGRPEPLVRFLSEPARRTVLWELASGQYEPRLTSAPTADGARDLRTRGFKLSRRRPSTFTREVVIKRLAAALKIARETLDVLFEVYGYRGQKALIFSLHGERKAVLGLMHTRLSARQLLFLLKRWGLPARERKQPREAPARVLRVGPRRLEFDAILSWPDEGTDEYARLVLSAAFEANSKVTLAVINRWNERNAAGRAVKVRDGSARLDCYLPLWLGMSEDHLKGTFSAFLESVKHFAQVGRNG